MTGIVGVSKQEYFSLTPAETYNRVQAYIYNRDVMASNFRALFHLQYNQWAKFGKSASELWPLSIDETFAEELTDEEMYKRNEKIIRQYRERYGVN